MLTTLVHALLPHPWLALLGLVLGTAVGATVLPTVAARRTLAQPVMLSLPEETTVLAGALCDLRRYPFLAAIDPVAFAVSSHHNIWAALRESLGSYKELPPDMTDDQAFAIGRELAPMRDAVLAATRAYLAERSRTPQADLTRLDELLVHGHTVGLDLPEDHERSAALDADVITAAEAVLATGSDRTDFAGLGLVVPSTTPNSTDPATPPLVREHTAPSTLRRVATGALSGLAAAVFPAMIVASGLTGAAAAAAVVALAALLGSSVVVSLVDLDTMFIDYPSWWAGLLGGWVAAIAATWLAGEPGRLVGGVAMTLGVAVFFEVVNWLFKLVRGHDGQGLGDTLIVLSTVGVPAAIAGDARVGYVSMMAGMIAALLGWVALRIQGRVRRNTPQALGPWLAAGWVLAMIWFCYDSQLLGALR